MSNLPSWVYAIVLGLLLIAAGAGEYLHMLPVNTFSSVFFLVLGLIAPSPVFPHISPAAVEQNTQALVQNTQVTQANTERTRG